MTKCPNCLKSNTISKKYSNNGFGIYKCSKCLNGFTHPIPKNLGKYYSSNYWASPGIIGAIKDLTFNFFQKRRRGWVEEYLTRGKIIDFGSGEGVFGKNLSGRFTVINIDSPDSKVSNKNVLKVDFLKWKTKDKFDAVVFWQSLEHTAKPDLTIKKAKRLLKKNGLIILEYPNNNSLEAKIFGRHWFHLDAPRHLSHLTQKSAAKLLKGNGFRVVKNEKISALEYTVWGLFVSTLSYLNLQPTESIKKSGSLLLFVIMSPFLIISFFIQILMNFVNNSSMAVTIARKL